MLEPWFNLNTISSFIQYICHIVIRRPVSGQMNQYYSGVRGWHQGALAPREILGKAYHGNQGKRILWTPLQGVPRSYPGRTPAPQDLQHCCVRLHTPLGDSGGANRGGNGRS